MTAMGTGPASTAAARVKAERAHAVTVEHTIADIAATLQEALGRELTAYIANVSDTKSVAKWARSAQTPRREAEDRLRAAFQTFHTLQAEDSDYTVRAWFIGLNPQLDDVAPAEAIRNGRYRDVLIAAKAYGAGG